MEVHVKFEECPILTVGLIQMLIRSDSITSYVFEVDDEEERDMLIDEIKTEVTENFEYRTL